MSDEDLRLLARRGEGDRLLVELDRRGMLSRGLVLTGSIARQSSNLAWLMSSNRWVSQDMMNTMNPSGSRMRNASTESRMSYVAGTIRLNNPRLYFVQRPTT